MARLGPCLNLLAVKRGNSQPVSAFHLVVLSGIPAKAIFTFAGWLPR
jgi:hypothetical protein